MRKDELRTRFVEALDRQDWTCLLDIGEQLHARGEYGHPAGVYAFWMEIAAGSVGRRRDAVLYSRLGIDLVAPGTELEARLLANGIYSAWLCCQPNRAIRLGHTYLERHAQYPPEGQALLPRVLHHMAMACQDREHFDQAIGLYQEALAEAEKQGEAALAHIIRADLAVAVVLQNGPQARQQAELLYQGLDATSLSGRTLFIYLLGRAELLHGCGDYAGSTAVVEQALTQADQVNEALVRQRTMLEFLKARNYWAQGNRYKAMLHGFQAALAFQGVGTRADLQRCRLFLQAVYDTAR